MSTTVHRGHQVPEGWHAVAGLAAVAATSWVEAVLLHLTNAATASTIYLLIVLIVAALSTLRVAVLVSVASVMAFNYFFLPPVGNFTIADPQNWVALVVFLAVSLVGSNLSATTRSRTREALARRDEVSRLFDLSRDVLIMTYGREALTHLARAIARRFDLDYVAIALPGTTDWDIAEAGAVPVSLDRRELASALAAAETRLEFDAYQRSYAGQKEVGEPGQRVRLIPLRVGTTPIGILAAAGRHLEAGTLDALAGVVAIGIERVQLLEERRTAALTKQREELKTAVLASIGHDLRTPLTAIAVAASNLQTPSLNDRDRAEQVDVILAEVERLTRLFGSLLEMARIDAGGIMAATRRVHPSEVIAAAREQVERTLADRPLEVYIDRDEPINIDPRLTSTALSHVLENAAQYAPPGTTITVTSELTAEGLVIAVRDRGRGIPANEAPHLFDRFFRGAAGQARPSGTGMGLWISRRLLAAQGARIWAENGADGGAQFTIVVPPSTTASA
jgi:two-component system sensor histidine kinase KdpD